MGKVGIGGRSRHLSIDARDGAHKAKGRRSGTARSTVGCPTGCRLGLWRFQGPTACAGRETNARVDCDRKGHRFDGVGHGELDRAGLDFLANV